MVKIWQQSACNYYSDHSWKINLLDKNWAEKERNTPLTEQLLQIPKRTKMAMRWCFQLCKHPAAHVRFSQSVSSIIRLTQLRLQLHISHRCTCLRQGKQEAQARRKSQMETHTSCPSGDYIWQLRQTASLVCTAGWRKWCSRIGAMLMAVRDGVGSWFRYVPKTSVGQ